MTSDFGQFRTGDLAVFRQQFSRAEFEAFAALSGDRNPLHHDAAYAEASEFGRPIVPLHMTAAPLSRIAGMIFPGDPSLYLGHELRSMLPVFYGDELTYSARVDAVNPALRTLGLRVLVIRGAEVVAEARMQVMAREERWTPVAAAPDLAPPRPASLVTGATGEIGTALALTLARRGDDLVLIDRGAGPKRAALAEALKPHLGQGQQVTHLAADLTDPQEVESLCTTLADMGCVTALYHVASPPLDAALSDLVQVNYAALERLAAAVRPAMLVRQEGVVVSIGSVATERAIPGWEHYSAAKAMAAQFLGTLDRRGREFGLRGLTVLSGLVATGYSASAQGSSPAMAPQELAEAVVEAATDPATGPALMVEWSGTRPGAYGFHDPAPRARPAPTAAAPAAETAAETAPEAGTGAALEERIAALLRAQLRLPAGTDLSGGGVGATPGWDSLRHIELILGLEQALGVQYGAADMDRMLTFRDLVAVTRSKL